MTKSSSKGKPKPLTKKDARKLEVIEQMMRRRNWSEARDELLKFTRKQPASVDGWLMLMDIGIKTDNTYLIWFANRRLLTLEPHEPDHRFNAAVTSAQLTMVFSTLHHITIYLDRWPDGPQVKDIHKMQEAFTSVWEDLRREDEMARGADLAALVLFEEGQMLVSHGEYREGRELSMKAAQLLPHAAAPLNNVSLSYMVEGKLTQALEVAQRVLADHPQNVHTCGNVAQCLIRLGRTAEAQPILNSLRDMVPDNPDHWRKIIETFAYAGDDEAVIETYTRALDALGKRHTPEPMVQHVAAVAYARTGDVKKARQLWKAALKQDSSLDVARENLADSRQPAGQINGAWYFPFQNWLVEDWLARIGRVFAKGERVGDTAMRRELEQTIKAVPGLEAVLPILLDRGDPVGREFVLHMAAHYPVPGLREFALGQRGTDEDRMEAARYASEHGELDNSQPVILYLEGEPRELLLLGFEIHSDVAESDFPEEVQKYLEAGVEALRAGEPEEALEWAEFGLELVPDAKEFLNQKGAALYQLGRNEEAEAVVRHTVDVHPDYLFARCGMAKLCARDNKLDEADAWLEPLMRRPRLHFSEFRALADAQIAVLMAHGRTDAAQSWVRIWDQIDPDSIPVHWQLLVK